jgi:hypothetical protein
MDDTKTIDAATYRLTIAGEEYEFGQPDPTFFERLVLISHMNAGGLLTIEALTKWLSSAAGPTVWGAIMKRFIDGSVTVQDLMKAMGDLIQLAGGKQDATSDAA